MNGSIVLLMGLALGAAFYQTGKVSSLKAENHQLESENAALIAGAALAEELRYNNAVLSEERDKLLMELKNAEDYNTLLSPAFRDALDGLRDPK